MEETKERHRKYLRAINNPIRRSILRSIEEGNRTIESISKDTEIDEKTLEWHLRILEDGFCVEKIKVVDQEKFILTKEGLVVNYLDQE
jgi:DNA-binding transcriptional ArsR family regulator